MFGEIWSERGAWLATRGGRFTASADVGQILNPKRRLTDEELIARKVADLKKPLSQLHEELEGDNSVSAEADVGHAREVDLVAAVPGARHNEALFIAEFSPALAATPDGVGDDFIVEVKNEKNGCGGGIWPGV